jgi:hypothetical protein
MGKVSDIPVPSSWPGGRLQLPFQITDRHPVRTTGVCESSRSREFLEHSFDVGHGDRLVTRQYSQSTTDARLPACEVTVIVPQSGKLTAKLLTFRFYVCML